MAIKKNDVACFIGEILASMTQVSDVAPGPLVFVPLKNFSLNMETSPLPTKD